jgi:hypothetical protein
MVEHLAKIQRDDLGRRVGAVLEMIGANFAVSTLGQRLKAVRERLMTQDVPEIPLLAGFEFPEWNKTWKVRTP